MLKTNPFLRILFLCILLGALPISHFAVAAKLDSPPQRFSGGLISSIRVEGAQRIEAETVKSYLSVKLGDPFDPNKIDESLKTLFATGLFADVKLERMGGTLLVKVVENPIINRVAFEGNKHIDDAALQSETQLRPRMVLSRTKVQSDVQRMQELYRRSNRFAATIEPKIIALDQNRVDLVYEINEGPKTGVERILFVGNKVFSDSHLKEIVRTKESHWYRFLSNDDTYDPDRLTYDKELLRRFYLSKGYADFQVVSAVAELSPDQQGFFITFTVEEGQPYTIGEVKLESHLPGLKSADFLQSQITMKKGDTYDVRQIEKTINNLTKALSDRQFIFVNIRPDVKRNPESHTLDITYDINEGPHKFIERINIDGNVRTLDRVIRREMQVAEGDPYNAAKLHKSEQNLHDLDFFEKVDVTTAEGSAPDRTIVDVDVEEKSTGEVSIGGGYSTTQGPLGNFNIKEHNFLGRGQDVSFSATLSGREQEFVFSFTEPYFLEKDLAAGVDLFRTTTGFQTKGVRTNRTFDEKKTGFGLRLGYPLSENLRQKISYRLEKNTISNLDSSVSRIIREQEGTRILSELTQTLTYDTTDSRLDPTDGYLVRLSNDLAGLGGDSRFLRTKLSGGAYYSPAENWVLSGLAETGYIFGIGKKVPIYEHFYLGGETLRGFSSSGVGPRDMTGGLKDGLGGEFLARGSLELSMPLGLPEELGVLGHIFTDAGTLTKSGVTPLPTEDIRDDFSWRASVGAGISWKSPIGPLRVDLGFPVLKRKYDEKEVFQFNFGTRF